MTAPVYPYFLPDGVTPMGYCQTSDVTARIKQGGYNPDSPGGITTAYLQQFILQAAAQIDMTLAVAGYAVPLVAKTGSDALGNPLTIGPQVYTMLTWINAVGAAAYVEMYRHAEDATSQDGQAEQLYHLMFMDHLSKLAHGRIGGLGQQTEGLGWNLSIAPFNLSGPFDPEADPAGAMDSGTSDMDWTGHFPAPIFTINPQQTTSDPTGGAAVANPLTTW